MRPVALAALGLVLVGGVSAAAAHENAAARAGSGPKITRFRQGLHGAPISITSGPRHSLWFTEGRGPGRAGAIGRITTRGVISEYRKGIHCAMFAQAAPITAGPDGNIWFGEACKRT